MSKNTTIPIDAILKECAAWGDDLVEAVSKEVLKEARVRARTVFKDVSGKTRKNIKRKKSKFGKDTRIVGAFWPTAHLIEYGTGMRVDKTGRVSGHMPATPFLDPAMKAVEERLPQIINNVVGDITITVE